MSFRGNYYPYYRDYRVGARVYITYRKGKGRGALWEIVEVKHRDKEPPILKLKYVNKKGENKEICGGNIYLRRVKKIIYPG